MMSEQHIIRNLQNEELFLLKHFLYEAIFLPEGTVPPAILLPGAFLQIADKNVRIKGIAAPAATALFSCAPSRRKFSCSGKAVRSCTFENRTSRSVFVR